MKLTPKQKTMTKQFDSKIYVDWEGLALDLCITKEDIALYKAYKSLAKKVYAQADTKQEDTVQYRT